MKDKVSDIGEKNLIKYILSVTPTITPDDASILKIDDLNLISTSDMLIQSRHFPSKMSFWQMGFKAVSCNISDLAAMGAEPLGFLLSIGIPKDLDYDSFIEIIDGVRYGCDFYSISLLGGDLNETDEIIISGTAFGSADKPLMKDSYDIGDLICITGRVGLAALGFHLDDDSSVYSKRALEPVARLKEGLILCDYATSATDITDGVASELYTIKKDGFGFMIYEDKFQVCDEFKNISNDFGLNYLDLLLYVGEDFELLFTIKEDDLDELPINCIVIGEVNESDRIEITMSDSTVLEVENRGYEHYVS